MDDYEQEVLQFHMLLIAAVVYIQWIPSELVVQHVMSFLVDDPAAHRCERFVMS